MNFEDNKISINKNDLKKQNMIRKLRNSNDSKLNMFNYQDNKNI